MASTYSTLGRIELMTQGEKDAVWGDITNSNLQLIEQMMHGYESIDLSLGNTYSLTTVNGSSDQGRKKILKFTGATAAVTVTVPSLAHEYLIWNAGNFDIVVRTTLGSGPTVPANTKTILFCDGTAVNTLSGLSTTPFTITLLDDPDAAAARATLGVPGLSANNTTNIFTDQTPLEVRWNDATTIVGPNLILARDSGTPAAGDGLGILRWRGRDANAVMQQYASLFTYIISTTPGSISGRIGINTPVGGTFADRFFFGNGFYTGTVAGGDRGADTINAKAYYIDGVQLSSTTAYLDYRDEKPQSTEGGTFNSGAWRTRDLTVEAYDTGGFGSLSANQITLAAGTYEADIRAPALAVDKHQARLQNITDATTIMLGNSAVTSPSIGVTTQSIMCGRFTLPTQKILEVQHQCSSTKGTDGFGRACNFSTELYTVARFWKLG